MSDDVRSLTREEAEERAGAARGAALRHRRRPARAARGRGVGLDLDDHVHLQPARREHVRRLRGRGAPRHPQRRATLDLGRGGRAAGSRCPTSPPRTCSWSRRRRPTPAAGTASCARSTPPTSLVYVWTSFEPDDARRAWACFDQPDLKAPHAFTVLAPAAWTVTSNSAPAVGRGRGPADDGGAALDASRTRRRSRRTSSVVNAGPFHELRREAGGHSLGLYCRQSLRQYLERDADDLFALTEAGPGVLRRAVRPAVPAGALRPGLRAQHGRRDGELGLRHLDRHGAVPLPAHARPARDGRRRCCCTRWRTCGSATW